MKKYYFIIFVFVSKFMFAQTGSSAEVGVTNGEMSVSLTGAAVYNVPIMVPPGINDVVPEISLNYYSQGGNGLAGYGWNIAGLSSITRTSSTKFHDETIDGIDFDNLDRYSFDGQRLMLKSGTYGANLSKYDTENASNIQITANGTSPYGAAYGPLSFYVQYPDGSVAFYGSTTDSRSRKEWALSYWQNPQGVRISYTYTTYNNNLYISSIKYGSRYTLTPINEIQFVYKTRQRAEQEYINGISFSNSYILSEVKVLGNGVGYRNYLLSHDITSLGYERLTSITEKNGDGTKSLNPTVFNYQNTADVINYNPLITTNTGIFAPPNPAITNCKVITSEFTGDGHMDFILYATNGSANKNKYWLYQDLDNPSGAFVSSANSGPFEEIYPVRYLNHFNEILTKDGWVIIQKGPSAGSVNFNIIAYAPSNPHITQYSRSHQFPTAASSTEIPKHFLSGDFNGDKLTDIVTINKYETVQGANYGGGTYLVNLDRRITSNFVSSTGYITITANSVIKVADYNGDGKSDIFVFDNGIVRVYSLGASNYMTQIASLSDAQIITSTTILMGDYNGDGKSDFIIPKAQGDHEYRKFLSTGLSFQKIIETYTSLPYTTSNQLNVWNWLTNDFNNDGKTDLIVMLCSRNQSDTQGQVSVSCYINKGGAFSRTTGNYITTNTGFDSQFDMFGIPLIMSADRANPKLELACLRNNKIYYFQSQKDFGKEQLMTSAINGNGVTKSITYSHLGPCNTPGCVNTYSLDASSTYPEYNLDQISDFYIVSMLEQVSSTNSKKQYYRYLNAVSNAEGLGFLGFRKILKTNWHQFNSQLTSTVSSYDLTRRGVLTNETTTLNWGILSTGFTPTVFITKKDYTYEDELLSNKVYKINNTQQLLYNGYEGTSQEINMFYDEYNNPTATYTNTKQGSTLQKSEALLIQYDNFVSGPFYYRGRPARKNTETYVDAGQMNSEEIYTYNSSLLLTKVEKKGHDTEYITEDNVYDAAGNVTKKTISAPGLTARETNFEYDASARFVTKITNPENLITEYTYDAVTGLTTSHKNPYGHLTQFQYDTWGKQIKVIDYLNNNTTTTYTNVAGQRSQALTNGADGSSSIIVYDDLQRDIINGQKNVDITWSYVMNYYDIYNRKVMISEQYGSLSGVPTLFNTLLYDIYGRITQKTTAAGKITNITYSGLSSTANDGSKIVTTVKNSIGNVISMTDNGGTITYQYYANDNMKQSSFGSTVTTIEQDGWGRKTKITDPSAGIFTYEYNHYGEVTKETNPKGTTTYTLDDNGKILEKTVVGDYTNTKTTFTYNPTTKLVTFKKFEDISGGFYNEYNYEYDNYNRLWRTDENTFSVYFQQATLYDGYGRPEQLYNSAVHVATGKRSDSWTKRTYKNGHAWQILDNDSGQVIWQLNTVNERGQLSTGVFGNGLRVTNTYDDYGFPTQIHLHTGKPLLTTVLKLDTAFNAPRGNLTTRSNSIFNWSESFQYDDLDRLTHYTNAAGAQEQQYYDARGRIASNTLGNYEYNNSSKPYQLSLIDIFEQGKSYFNNREGIFSDGMEDNKGWTTYYDPANITYDTSKSHTGETSIKISNNSGTEKMVFSEIYTRIDNSVATQYTFSAWVYSEGPQTELFMYMKTDLNSPNFTFSQIQTNATGYWKYLEKTITVPANVKYLSLRLDNNQNGNVWFDDVRIRKTSDATTVRKLDVTYNVANNPIDISETGIDRISFTYHETGARYTSFYGSTAVNKNSRPLVKHYSSDGVMEVKYNKVTGEVEFTTFVGGNGYNSNAMYRSDGTYTQYLYLHRDYQGTIMAITNQTATVVEKRLFDAWGNIIKVQDNNGNILAGLTVLDRGYTGHEHLQSVNLIHMNGRIYDPKVRRFLQPDNFVQDAFNTQNHNRYGYALNNPLKYTDESGEFLGTIVTAIWEGVTNIIEHGINFDHYDWDRTENAWKIDVGLLRLDSNRTFFGQVLQLVSRFTWELPQTTIGYGYSHISNIGRNVDEVLYFGGATFVINENEADKSRQGVSLGNFINIRIKGDVQFDHAGGWINSEDGLFWHEYGHTFQSMRLGLSYLFAVAIPSAVSVKFDDWQDTDKHMGRWYEKQANRWARRYADKYGYQFDMDPTRYVFD